MLKRLRTAHPILYCILSEVLFLGSMVLFSLLATIGLAAAGADFDTMDGYLLGSVQEAVGLAVALLLLARTGRLDLLHRRGCGFLNGMLVGMYPLFFIGYTTVGTLAFDRPDTPLLPLPRILTFMLNMILVGVAEELVFRGIIAQTLLERYKVEAPAGTPGWQLLEMAARKRGYLISGGEVNTERMAKVLLDEFRSGKLGNFTLEMPEDMV